MSYTPLELAKTAAYAADEKKASDIVLIDLSELSDVCDYFLVCSATNAPQIDAVLENIEEKLRLNYQLKPFSAEGRENRNWVLLDYGSLVVHVFMPEVRDYYRLEKLWGDAPRIELEFEA